MLTLASALFGLKVWPVRTNAAFLLACLNDADFQSGDVTTGLIADRGDALTQPTPPGDTQWKLAALQMFAPTFAASQAPIASPWAHTLGFRINAPEAIRMTVQHHGEQRVMMLEECVDATGFTAQVEGGVLAYADAQPYLFTEPRFEGGAAAAGSGAILAPMPGKIIAVEVAAGDTVTKGQKLLTLEAMKMEHTLTAPFDGVVAELNASAGQQVQVEALLAKIEEATE